MKPMRARLARIAIASAIASLGTSAGGAREGTELLYRADPKDVEPIVRVLEARLGPEVEIRKGEAGLLVVKLPQETDLEEARSLIEARGQLEIILEATPADWADAQPEQEKAKLLEWLGDHPDAAVSTWPSPRPDRIVWARDDRKEKPLAGRIVALVRSERPEWRFTQDDLASCSRTVDEFSSPAIGLQLEAERARSMGELTTANIHRKLAVVLDGTVLALAHLEGPLSAFFQITFRNNRHSERDFARALALLRSGALPGPITFVEARK